MYTIRDHFSGATQANMKAQIEMCSALTNKTIESIGRLADLNMHVARASWEESDYKIKQMISANDPREFFSTVAGMLQPNPQNNLAYGCHAVSIGANTQIEVIRVVEEETAEVHRQITVLINDVTKNAPTGLKKASALVKSVLDTANVGFGQLSRTARYAFEALESNLIAAANQLARSADKGVSYKKGYFLRK